MKPNQVDMKVEEVEARARLTDLRRQIDLVDERLLDLLVERFAITRQVGDVKRLAGLPPADPIREAEMYERLRSGAAAHGLDPDTIEDIYRALLSHVVREHSQPKT